MFVNRSALGDQSGDSSRCFRLLLVATLADGSELTLRSDANSGEWKSRHGAIVYDHLWQGEIYDSRQEAAGGPAGWIDESKPMERYPAGHTAAVAVHPVAGSMFPQLMPGIRVVESYEAQSTVDHNDSVLFDFGLNMAGYTTLNLEPSTIRTALLAMHRGLRVGTMTKDPRFFFRSASFVAGPSEESTARTAPSVCAAWASACAIMNHVSNSEPGVRLPQLEEQAPAQVLCDHRGSQCLSRCFRTTRH